MIRILLVVLCVLFVVLYAASMLHFLPGTETSKTICERIAFIGSPWQ